ncbi:MAG: sigma-70 family RNA polymerase sigma factor [Chloroflexi bacterium]|nr:sigma-70 family RNA polymerase sigma factor [Chloroflexota bacterium]MBU1750404.1 sigma-70 family RNA polymerase sigma factor [Chloroflexota bacterium]
MDESALIAASQKGDTAAFNQLVWAYQERAYNLAYRMLGHPDQAADATQDAFFSAYRAIKGFRGGSFRAWILRIVSNACYDQLRRKQRRPTTSLDALFTATDEYPLSPSIGDGPEEQVLRRELWETVGAGLQTLPPDQREAVILRDIQGLDYDEIAQVTQVSLGTVKSRISRGRARLRDYLQQRPELLPPQFRL